MGISHFNSLWWLYGYPKKYERDGCLLSQPFLLVPSPIRKGVIYNKVFVLLIPRCSASSSMPPIGTNGVGLTYRTSRCNLSLNTRIDNWSRASEAALIEDTRQKELFFFPNFTFNKRRFISKICFLSRIMFLSRKTESNKKKIKSHHLCNS